MSPRSRFRQVSGGVTAAQGFSAAGVRCGLKIRKEALDLGLIVSDRPCAAAGVFTTSQAAAAPVQWSRAVAARGTAQAVVANSGNANCCTGKQGDEDAAAMAVAAAQQLNIDPDMVCVGSTGIIGRPLDVDKVVAGIMDAAEQLSPDEDGGDSFARAIMTTDTRQKTVAVKAVIDGSIITVGGSCKGSGMIQPNMATMLCFVTTDADISAAMLRQTLKAAADKSFNRITIDGDMSTNDTLLVLANGAAGNARIARPGRALRQFCSMLEFVCVQLAQMMARDGEGATKFVEVAVRGAATQADALRIARAVANSPLVKCAINGCDPNWGRIIASASACGARFDPARAELRLGGKLAFHRGVVADTPRRDLEKVMKGTDILIELDLRIGRGAETMWTCDMSREYVSINADYHT